MIRIYSSRNYGSRFLPHSSTPRNLATITGKVFDFNLA
jgi:hypothetical protein